MSRPTVCLLALISVHSLALSQATPPPSVGNVKIDPVKALPMPQGIKDLLVFRGAPVTVQSQAVKNFSLPIKGLSPADKLALVRRAAASGGTSAAGSSMGPYLMLSRQTMRTEGRGNLTFLNAQSVTDNATMIGARGLRGAVELAVYPDGAGRVYLVEWQAGGGVMAGAENPCRLFGCGGRELTFRLSGGPATIVPMVFESASTGLHGFRFECDQPWQFVSVEVTMLR
jgi:hypothetical protein